jgi:hypothetical protein
MPKRGDPISKVLPRFTVLFKKKIGLIISKA